MKRKAVAEVLGLEMRPSEAKEMFRNAYIYLLQSDTQSLMQTLDYRETLSNIDGTTEKYLIFKFILKLLLNQNPKQLERLCPAKQYHLDSSRRRTPYRFPA